MCVRMQPRDLAIFEEFLVLSSSKLHRTEWERQYFAAIRHLDLCIFDLAIQGQCGLDLVRNPENGL